MALTLQLGACASPRQNRPQNADLPSAELPESTWLGGAVKPRAAQGPEAHLHSADGAILVEEILSLDASLSEPKVGPLRIPATEKGFVTPSPFLADDFLSSFSSRPVPGVLGPVLVPPLGVDTTDELSQADEPGPEEPESGPVQEKLGDNAPTEDLPEQNYIPKGTRIPIEINERVKKWIRYFTVVDRDRFERFMRNGSNYRPLVERILQDEGVPKELYYLALIESGFQLHARSRVGAVGGWQFMRFTGKRYGLKITREIDERRDPIKSTRAAARYLTVLHGMFENWYLAMASYNAGEGRILKAIRKGGSRDFWELAAKTTRRKRVLPRETMDYIPKYMAAVLVGEHPEAYGLPRFTSRPHPELHVFRSPARVSFESIAQAGGLSVEELKLYNPQFVRGYVPAGGEVWVAAESLPALRNSSEVLARQVLPAEKPEKLPRYHKVRRGESLSDVADMYGISVDRLKRLNGIRGTKVRRGTRLRLAQESTAADARPSPLATPVAAAKTPARRIAQVNRASKGSKKKK